MTEKELDVALKAFADAVAKADLTESKKINFFSATKMLSLETKHSAFFAWLIYPKNEHRLKNTVLKLLLQKLYSYSVQRDSVTPKPRTNIEILKDTRQNTEESILSEHDLIARASENNIGVYTEKATNNGRRIDILIDIIDTQTVIIIENKIGSTTQNNQLQEYQSYVAEEFPNYKKKIFVYLTKDGELPYDTDAKGKRTDYNGEWCTLDYGEMRCIIEEVLEQLSNNAKTKTFDIDPCEQDTLKIILEHYIKMVDTSILNTSHTAREKCKDFLADPEIQTVLEIIEAYKRIPTPEQIRDYVCEKLGGKLLGTSKAWFYIQPMKDYFTQKNNEEYSIAKLRCVCQPEQLPKNSPKEPRMVLYVNMACGSDSRDELTAAQKALLLDCGESLVKRNGEPRKDVTLFGLDEPLVGTKELGMDFNDLKPILDRRIEKFRILLDNFVKEHL